MLRIRTNSLWIPIVIHFVLRLDPIGSLAIHGLLNWILLVLFYLPLALLNLYYICTYDYDLKYDQIFHVRIYVNSLVMSLYFYLTKKVILDICTKEMISKFIELKMLRNSFFSFWKLYQYVDTYFVYMQALMQNLFGKLKKSSSLVVTVIWSWVIMYRISIFANFDHVQRCLP